MNYTATKVEAINKKEMVWFEGMLMTREEAQEMRENR